MRPCWLHQLIKIGFEQHTRLLALEVIANDLLGKCCGQILRGIKDGVGISRAGEARIPMPIPTGVARWRASMIRR